MIVATSSPIKRSAIHTATLERADELKHQHAMDLAMQLYESQLHFYLDELIDHAVRGRLAPLMARVDAAEDAVVALESAVRS